MIDRNINPIKYQDGNLILLDQRKLPAEKTYVILDTPEKIAEAIKTMVVRGAPAIGVTAGYGMAIGLMKKKIDKTNLKKYFFELIEMFSNTRPTAVNLFWALKRIEKLFTEDLTQKELAEKVLNTALDIHEEDEKTSESIGKYGNTLIKDGNSIITHCNAGILATGGMGTALAVIYEAKNSGKNIHVFADETRPRLQGSKLTVWELMENGVDTTLISDNMAAWVMKQNKADIIITGADRIAGNGDSANKIGTYSLAVNAARHKVPFYIAAPLSTIDINIKTGDEIEIEERDENEVKIINGDYITVPEVKIYNPAFDVTPNELITGIITDKGIIRQPYSEEIKKLFK